MKRDTFLAIDGHSMIYRSVHSRGRALTSPGGEPTRGTFIFFKALFELVARIRPQYLVMAEDEARSKTFRRQIFPAYKANRKPHAEEDPSIPIQLQRIKQVTRELGIPILRADGFEADDVLASLADVCASDDVEVVIVSSDKDLQQLVNENVIIHNTFTGDFNGIEEVEARWGVPPSMVVDMQTLMGDPTDGIPGVKGIGEVKALKLLQEYGSVEDVVDAAEEGKLSPKLCEAVLATDIELQRTLVKLRTDVPLDIDEEQLEFNGLDVERAGPLFRELGFNDWT